MPPSHTEIPISLILSLKYKQTVKVCNIFYKSLQYKIKKIKQINHKKKNRKVYDKRKAIAFMKEEQDTIILRFFCFLFSEED